MSRGVSRRAAGFTLIEAMIALAIMAILGAMAVPNFQRLLAERRVLAAASEYVGALRTAQAEAIRRNRTVEVLFTGSDPVPANTASARAVTSGAGGNRLVRAASKRDASDYVAGYGGGDTSAAVAIDAGTVTSIAFTSTGRPLDYTDASGGQPLTGPVTVRFTDALSSRRLCALLSPGGSVRICDPQRAATDPAGCPAALPRSC